MSTLASQKPYFAHPLHDQSTEKDSITLRVVVVASPAATLLWIVDGMVVSGMEGESVIYEDGIGIFSIKNLKIGTTYVSCTAKNEHGICSTSATVTRKVKSELEDITQQKETKSEKPAEWKDENEKDMEVVTTMTEEIILKEEEKTACSKFGDITTSRTFLMSEAAWSKEKDENVHAEKLEMEKITKSEEEGKKPVKESKQDKAYGEFEKIPENEQVTGPEIDLTTSTYDVAAYTTTAPLKK
ncbi:unnamed protein product, partial [Haemonchus placei]|uniref:Ig-like domain-containing protein n=1 Tax=Haemonchus placei TaxID=6290 RepID=A0A0N4WZT0_HAEPC